MENTILFQNRDDIKNFIVSGKASFTVESIRTNVSLTFKVNKCKDKNMFFVSVNIEYEKYLFIGNLWSNETLTSFTFRKSKKLINEPVSIVAFNYIVTNYLNTNNPHKDMNFYHFGRCGRCGRTLTTPESIKRGLGPECSKR